MKYLFPLFISVLVLLAPISLPAAEKNGDSRIESIFFHGDGDREIVQIVLSGKVIPKVFELNGKKPRVVLDFVDTGYMPKDLRVIEAGGKLVSRVRVGLHAQPVAKTRVVIDIGEGGKYSFTKEYLAAKSSFQITFTSPKQPKEKQVQNKKADHAAAKSMGKSAEKKHPKASQNKVAEKNEEAARMIAQSATGNVQDKDNSKSALKSDTAGMDDNIKEKKEDLDDGVKTDATKVGDKTPQLLLDVTYEKNNNGNEMVLFQMNGFYPPIVYSAESGELLVVCDFLGVALGPDFAPAVLKGGRYIVQVNVESYQQPKKVRVVLKLAEKYTYDLKQVFFKEDNLFVVVLNRLGENKKND